MCFRSFVKHTSVHFLLHIACLCKSESLVQLMLYCTSICVQQSAVSGELAMLVLASMCGCRHVLLTCPALCICCVPLGWIWAVKPTPCRTVYSICQHSLSEVHLAGSCSEHINNTASRQRLTTSSLCIHTATSGSMPSEFVKLCREPFRAWQQPFSPATMKSK